MVQQLPIQYEQRSTIFGAKSLAGKEMSIKRLEQSTRAQLRHFLFLIYTMIYWKEGGLQ